MSAQLQYFLLSYLSYDIHTSWLVGWNRETTTKRNNLSTIISFVVKQGIFSHRVKPIRRTNFELSITWPQTLTSTKLQHAKCLQSQGVDRITHYHPKTLAFDESLKRLPSKKGDNVVTVWRIPLLFSVETHVHGTFNMTWRNYNTKLLYVELNASVDTYGLSNYNQAFVVVG